MVSNSLGAVVLSTLAASRLNELLGGGTQLLPATAEGQQSATRVATAITGTASSWRRSPCAVGGSGRTPTEDRRPTSRRPRRS